MHLLFAALLALTQPWLVVSDLHVEPFDTSTAIGYNSDSHWALFDETIAEMRRAEPNPKVVVIGGDFLQHHFASAVAAEQTHLSVAAAAEAEMSRIARGFAKAFPRAQFLIALGNNDDPCGDYSTAPNTPYLASLARIWGPLVNRNGAAPDFIKDFTRAGSYTARLPFKNGRAVVIDDVAWSILFHSCGRSSVNLSALQVTWFAQAMKSRPHARDIVLMHIPPGVDANSTLLTHRFIVISFLRGNVESQVEQIVSSNRERIPLILAGHQHANDFRILGGVPLLVAPSISPIYRNNPAFLRLEVDGDGTLRNYQQFAYDPDSATWAQALDFDRAFGVDAFTAKTINIVHDRLADDAALRQVWSSAMVGGSRNVRADSQTWRAYWCAQTFTSSGYVACAGDQRRVTALPLAVALIVAIVLLGLVAAGLRLATQHRRA
jgi:Calcineurin-like phosphoesterase